MSCRILVAILLLGFLSAAAIADDEDRLAVVLRDGTRLVGSPGSEGATLLVDGKDPTEFRWGQVSYLAFDDDRESAHLYLEGAALPLTGILAVDAISIEGALGRLDLPVTELLHIGRHGDPEPATTRRVKEADGFFPPHATRLDFQTDPEGKDLVIGQDVSGTFVPEGVSISTSIEGAIVSVNDYVVDSPSGSLSCATHRPLWEGVLTIRFCIPGHAHLSAGVHRVGLWIAHVFPDGTSMEAYGIDGRLLATIATTANGSEFLGLESSVPIHSLRIVPDPAIDPNYTIDDLTYDSPRALAAGDATLHAVELRTGDLVRARRVVPGETSVRLEGLTITDQPVELDLDQLRTVAPPAVGGAGQPVGAFWVRLFDGSTVRGAVADEAISAARFPESPLTLDDLTALWGDETPYAEPRDPERPAPGHLVLIDGSGRFHVSEWDLVAGGLQFHEGAGGRKRADLASAPVIWFRKPGPYRSTIGRLRLVGGEEFVLDPNGRFQMTDWTERSVVLASGEATLEIPIGEVHSIGWPSD